MKHLITLLFVFQLFAGSLWNSCFGQGSWGLDPFDEVRGGVQGRNAAMREATIEACRRASERQAIKKLQNKISRTRCWEFKNGDIAVGEFVRISSVKDKGNWIKIRSGKEVRSFPVDNFQDDDLIFIAFLDKKAKTFVDNIRPGLADKFANMIREYERAANKARNPVSWRVLGMAYIGGTGIPVNFPEGIMWLEKAAQEDDVIAQRTLGFFYVQVGGDCIARGVKWLRKAAEKGDPFAKRVFSREAGDSQQVAKKSRSRKGKQKKSSKKTAQSKAKSSPSTSNRNAGDRMVKTVDGVEYAFRWCPPGTFTMVANDETKHQVTLTKGFWILETEVTQAMWQSVIGENIRQKAAQGTVTDTLYGEGPNYPIYYVSWEDCQVFCRRLSSKIGMIITLPTEAQWEYACRAGTTGEFAGDLNAMGWYKDNTDKTAHPVRQKNANAWGLYDMHGNVFEWCQDCYSDNLGDNMTDPTGPMNGTERVIRGGNYECVAIVCRSCHRVCMAPYARLDGHGFRIVSFGQ